MSADLSNEVVESNFIITERNEGQKYENIKTQVVENVIIFYISSIFNYSGIILSSSLTEGLDFCS